MKFVTTSPAMQRVAELVDRVAVTASNVLVLGESGTGKDATARLIHDRSPRQNLPYVKIDCAALPEDLLESELFGYEKGAFTGASDSKPGRLEAADGGTLVLDEIASLIPSSQAKLLRVIEERRFERLGGKQSIQIDVRLIALATLDLKEAGRAQIFCRDCLIAPKTSGRWPTSSRNSSRPAAGGRSCKFRARRWIGWRITISQAMS